MLLLFVWKLTCFMPFGISFEPEAYQLCKASLRFAVLDDLEMLVTNNQDVGFYRIDNTFSYFVRGVFDYENRTVKSGIDVDLDEDLIRDLAIFDGEYVQIFVDRINIEFVDA